MMPELDGLSVCRAVRRTNNVPIIFLTALSDEDDKLLGYELGADDYITKPFSMSVLYAKTMALIKRNQRNVLAGDRMETGGITLEPVSYTHLDVYKRQIGYLAGSTGFDEDDMNEKVNNMVVAINEMIQSNPKTKGNVWIDINDLVLSSVYVAMEPNEVYASLTENHVDVNNVIDTLGTKDGVNANDSITSVATNTIDGSYHFTKVVGKVVQIYWHDQTTGVSTCLLYTSPA